MILPLAEIAQKLRNGVGQFLLQAQLGFADPSSWKTKAIG
jgi:hypothetical protein